MFQPGPRDSSEWEKGKMPDPSHEVQTMPPRTGIPAKPKGKTMSDQVRMVQGHSKSTQLLLPEVTVMSQQATGPRSLRSPSIDGEASVMHPRAADSYIRPPTQHLHSPAVGTRNLTCSKRPTLPMFSIISCEAPLSLQVLRASS